jgi:hypothetical protein
MLLANDVRELLTKIELAKRGKDNQKQKRQSKYKTPNEINVSDTASDAPENPKRRGGRRDAEPNFAARR